MPKTNTLSLIVALIALSPPAHAIYKCAVDGKTVYQPAPCADSPEAAPIDLKQPPSELQAKMHRQQLERNAEIAKQDLDNAKRQVENDRLNFYKRLDQDRIDINNRYNQRMQQIQQESYRQQMDSTCFSRTPGARSDECQQWRYDKRWSD